jgi:hypothetical protein
MDLSALVAGSSDGQGNVNVMEGVPRPLEESTKDESFLPSTEDEKEGHEVIVVDDDDSKVNSVSMYTPLIFGNAPTERLSALCAQVGKYFLIQGGFQQGRGCLSDCLVRTATKTLRCLYLSF